MRTMLLAVSFASTLFVLPAGAADFSGNEVNLVGSAVMQNDELQLTGNLQGQAGAAWLTPPLATTRSFAVTYDFVLANAGKDTMADGVALVFQNKGATALGNVEAGSNLAYVGLDGVGSVVQTWYNDRLGLNIDGNPLSSNPAPVPLGAAQLVTGSETVSYDAAAHRLSMSGTLNVDGKILPISDSVTIDLAAKFGPNMYLGFTGATGAAFAEQRISRFALTVVPEPRPAVVPQDNSGVAPPEKFPSLLLIGLGVLCGLGLLLVVLRRRQRRAD